MFKLFSKISYLTSYRGSKLAYMLKGGIPRVSLKVKLKVAGFVKVNL